MNLLEAAIMGAAYTIVFLYFIGEKIIKVDFSGLLKRNWKSTKCKKNACPVEGTVAGNKSAGRDPECFQHGIAPSGKSGQRASPRPDGHDVP